MHRPLDRNNNVGQVGGSWVEAGKWGHLLKCQRFFFRNPQGRPEKIKRSSPPFSFLPGGRNSTFLSHSVSNQANVPQALISSWLSTDPAKDRIEITSLLPGGTLSVNSLDVLGPCLVCGTDAEAIYVTRQLFSWKYFSCKISGGKHFEFQRLYKFLSLKNVKFSGVASVNWCSWQCPVLCFVSWKFP